jgi:hypothetical protein
MGMKEFSIWENVPFITIVFNIIDEVKSQQEYNYVKILRIKVMKGSLTSVSMLDI